MLAMVFMLVTLTTMNDSIINATSSLNKARIVDELQRLCPGADICPEHTTAVNSNDTVPSDFESCCSGCSCDKDCMKDGNCCFLDPVPSEQDLNNLSSQTEVQCLLPISVQPTGKDRNNYPSYLMVTSVARNDVKGGGGLTSGSTCGDVKVAPWGSIHPVYSKKAKRLYKNAACAETDSVEDGELWDTILVCSGRDKSGVLVTTNYMSKLYSGIQSEDCHILFIYTGDINDLDPFKCYLDTTNMCSKVDFQVPVNVNLTQKEIREACSAGPISPFRGKLQIYANIFCYICNIKYFPEDAVCKKQSGNEHRYKFNKGFVGLLSGHFTADNVQISARASSPSTNCLTEMNLKCREIFCPSAQLRDRNGKCRYLHDLWYNQVYTVVIELTPDREIAVNDTLDLKSRLISPWPEPWGIAGLFLTENEERSNITNICVELRTSFSAVRPNIIIRNITTMVNRVWSLRSNNETYTFTSRFMRTAPYRTQHDQLIFVGNRSETIPWIKFIPLFKDSEPPVLTKLEHIVTKMYLCEQVEFGPSEIILNRYDSSVLYIKHSKRILFEYEFTLISEGKYNAFRARVCIEDSGLNQNGRFPSSRGNSIIIARTIVSVWVFYMMSLAIGASFRIYEQYCSLSK